MNLRLHLCCISGRTIAIRAQGLSDLSRQTRVIELYRRCCSSADLRWAVGLPFSINSTRTGPASRKAGVKAARKSPIRPAQIECRSAAGRQQQRIVAVKGRGVARDVAQFGRSALASDMPPLQDTCAQGMAREAWSASPSGGQNRPPFGTTTPRASLYFSPRGRAGGMTDPGLGRQLPVPATLVSVIALQQPAFRVPPIARGRDARSSI